MKLSTRHSALITAALLALLAGCAELTDPAVIRVIEYGATGGGLLTDAAVGGCSVYQAESKASAAGKGSTRVTLVYQGQRCAAQVQSK